MTGTATWRRWFFPGSTSGPRRTAAGSKYAYDLSGRLLAATRADGVAGQQYEYDAFGNIMGIIDGESNRTQYVLDEWGRIVEVKRADGVSEFCRYDYAGNIAQSVDGNGNSILYEYNRAGKLSRMTDPMGCSEEYHYDPGNRLTEYRKGGMCTKFEYDSAGNLLADDKARYAYDAFNRMGRAASAISAPGSCWHPVQSMQGHTTTMLLMRWGALPMW